MLRRNIFGTSGLVLFLAGMVIPAMTFGGEPEYNDTNEYSTIETVKMALEAEAVGDLEKRQSLLQKAIDNTDAAPARWQSGYLTSGKDSFQTIAESTDENQSSLKLSKYRYKRKKLTENAAGHLAMAQWCADENLLPQARAHLNRTIEFDPNNDLARNALGFQRAGNAWISPEEIQKLADQSAAKSQSIQQYGKQIAKLVKQMNSLQPKTRDGAIAKLMELTDVAAVGAVENGLASPNIPPSKLAVEWMAQIDCVESSLVLAKYSLLHPSDEVRELATIKLMERPLHDFVPEILDMLTSSIRTTIVPSFDRNGALLGYRQSFTKENFESKDFVVINHQIQRVVPVVLSTRSRNIRWERLAENAAVDRAAEIQNELIAQNAEKEVADRLQAMERENQEIEKRNQLIANVIAVVSEQPYTEDVPTMWQWWDQYNETGYQEYKPERYTAYNELVQEYYPQPPRPVSECFVAGTQVMTELGLQNIESIVAGDRVLSRNLTTSELSWTPVLQRTERPASDTVKISTADESFQCTNGHLFWVSGKGWQKASDLQQGDVLHGAEKPVLVESIQSDIPVETFNLNVADDHNYFVGQAMIITHDVTPRGSNRQQVPGQNLLQNLAKK